MTTVQSQLVDTASCLSSCEAAVTFLLPRSEYVNPDGVPALTVLIHEQAMIESYRGYSTIVPAKQWNAMLSDAQKSLDQLIDIYNSAPNDKDKFLEARARVHDPYFNTMNEFAKSRGKSAATPAPAKVIFLRIAVDALDGEIRYMTAGHWELFQHLQRMKKVESTTEPPWITLAQNSTLTVGAPG